MPILSRIVSLIVRPGEEWDRIAREQSSVDTVLRRVILPLPLLPLIATVIGMNVFDRAWDPLRGYQVPPEQIFAAGAATYFGSVGSILLLAGVFVLIAPMYRVKRDYRAALNVAAYGAVPVLLAGATLIVPVMVMVAIVALCHTLYLYWLGAERLLGVHAEERFEFVGIAVVLQVAASVLVGGLAGALGIL